MYSAGFTTKKRIPTEIIPLTHRQVSCVAVIGAVKGIKDDCRVPSSGTDAVGWWLANPKRLQGPPAPFLRCVCKPHQTVNTAELITLLMVL